MLPPFFYAISTVSHPDAPLHVLALIQAPTNLVLRDSTIRWNSNRISKPLKGFLKNHGHVFQKKIYRKLKVAIYKGRQYQKEIFLGTYTLEHLTIAYKIMFFSCTIIEKIDQIFQILDVKQGTRLGVDVTVTMFNPAFLSFSFFVCLFCLFFFF